MRPCSMRPCIISSSRTRHLGASPRYASHRSRCSGRAACSANKPDSPQGQPSAAEPVSTFFNREEEGERLAQLCKRPPTAIRVVLGPRSCGKTALLSHSLEGQQHAVIINCRDYDVSDPAVFSKVVIEELLPKIPEDRKRQVLAAARELLTSLSVTGGSSSPGFSIKASALSWLAKLLPSNTTVPTTPTEKINDVYSVIRTLLSEWEDELVRTAEQEAGGRRWPVVIVDEANKLMSWSDEHPQQLASLLSFFVRLTKEQSRCHVMLATSEYGFQAWLNNAIGPGFWKPVVIGDFDEGEARRFLKWQLNKLGSDVTVNDASWAKVYSVCGGNAGTLRQLACDVSISSNWDTALKVLKAVELSRVRALARGRQGYSAEQYADAAIALLDAKHHAVPLADMLALLGRHVVGAAASDSVKVAAAGEPALQRLVEVNALSVRPFSEWAKDIPAEAFGPDVEPVVTAPSAVDLSCMRSLEPGLRKQLPSRTQEQQGTGDAASQALSPGSPSSPQEQDAMAAVAPDHLTGEARPGGQ